MIRTIAMLLFWTLAAPVAAIIGFPATFIMGMCACCIASSCGELGLAYGSPGFA